VRFTSRVLTSSNACSIHECNCPRIPGRMREKEMTSDGRDNHDLIDTLYRAHAQYGEPRRRIHEILQA
jgi:hypothetical protein